MKSFFARLKIIHALLVRDALRKYGHENLGFFWVVVEPMCFTVGIIVLWNLMGRGEGHGNISITAFALTAYTMLTLWRHLSQGFMHILRFNAGVLYHAHIRPFDIMLARGLLETFGCLGTFFMVYVPLTLLDVIDPWRDPLLLFGGWFLGAWFSFSFGVMIGALSEMSEVLERIIHPAMYLTLPLTGAFTMQDWMPEKARDFLGYSPLVNTFEMFRAGMFDADVVTYWSVPYVLWWCLGLSVLGLFLVGRARSYIFIY
ncbi:MAG TPA: ABC transporter permease [Methylocella sp.]|nr:ABC transporter permease [Methylocella sp.]